MRAAIAVVVGVITLVVFFGATLKVLDWWSVPSADETNLRSPDRLPGPNEAPITRETVLSDLPNGSIAGFKWIGIEGANVQVGKGDSIIDDQPLLKIVAIPTESRHFLAGRATSLRRERIYRLSIWVKATPGIQVQIESTDGMKQQDGKYENYGVAIFDPDTHNVTSSSGKLLGRGIEKKTGDWQKLWIDMPVLATDQLIIVIGIMANGASTFKGDGRLGVILGGIEIVPGDKMK